MKKILITGGNGLIGTVLTKSLEDFSPTVLDLPDHDVRNYALLKENFLGQDAIIHLAWNTKTENAGSKTIDPDNTAMFARVYEAALETGVPRVIMASSVHAYKIPPGDTRKLISPYDLSDPNNPYGANKLFMEIL